MIASLLLAVLLAGLLGAALRDRRAAVRPPELHFGASAFNHAILARLESLRTPYAPTPWLFNAHLQLLWLLLQEALAPPLQYDRRDTLRMRDGGTTALHWLGLDRPARAPTLVVLHSITGDARSTRVLVDALHRATGWRVVLCERRGHGDLRLTAPVVNTMGCTDDLREQLREIRARVPGSPLYGVGVSAGSALLVRYLGEEGPRALIRAGVAYCPGYDLGIAWGRVHAWYSRAMALRLKQHFLQRHAPAFSHLGGFRACMATQDLAGFHEAFHELAGCASPADWLARANPMPVIDGIAVPLMILNADDDPVCVVQNTLEHQGAIRRIPDALLVRTARGSHCAFLEGWGAHSWANRLIASYLLAADGLLRAAPAARAARRGPAQAASSAPARRSSAPGTCAP